MKTQNAMILAYLQRGRSITPIDGLKLFGTFRLSGRVFELKERGYDIKTTMVEKHGKRFASYSL